MATCGGLAGLGVARQAGLGGAAEEADLHLLLAAFAEADESDIAMGVAYSAGTEALVTDVIAGRERGGAVASVIGVRQGPGRDGHDGAGHGVAASDIASGVRRAGRLRSSLDGIRAG